MTKKEVEKLNIHDPFFRRAIWEAHKKRCAYSGAPIRFSELQIDHIIPQRLFDQPTELKSLLDDLGLPDDFHKDNPENLLPTLGFANRQKSDQIEPLQIKHALNTALRKLSDIKAIYRRIKSNDDIDVAKLMLFHGVRTGEIVIADIRDLLNELRTGSASAMLKRPLIFAEGEIVDISGVSEPCSLLDIPICPRNGGLPHLTLVNDSDTEEYVKNCRGWLNGIKRGYEAVQ